MTLRHIEVFHAVMLTGTVNGAARLLNVTQPAATRILQHAEARLGFKLFTRSKGRVIPTKEAGILFNEAAKIFAGLDTIRSLARNLRTAGADRVRLAVPPALCLRFIPDVIASAQKAMPETVFEVHSHHYGEAVAAVLRQDVELAIVFNPQDHPALLTERLAVAAFVGCFPSNASLPPVISLSAFRKWPFIALSGRDPLGNSVKSALQRARVDLRASIEVNTNGLALALVEGEAGAAVLDEYTAAALGARTAIRRIEPALSFEVGIINLGNAETSNSIKQVRQLLHSHHSKYLFQGRS
jgi:DNA-binding transcriptional LysR family regulator